MQGKIDVRQEALLANGQAFEPVACNEIMR